MSEIELLKILTAAVAEPVATCMPRAGYPLVLVWLIFVITFRDIEAPVDPVPINIPYEVVELGEVVTPETEFCETTALGTPLLRAIPATVTVVDTTFLAVFPETVGATAF